MVFQMIVIKINQNNINKIIVIIIIINLCNVIIELDCKKKYVLICNNQKNNLVV